MLSVLMNSEKNTGPVFVLCAARTGSTLLRSVLDAHPDFCCPPELHLGWLADSLAWVYKYTGPETQPGNEDYTKASERNIRNLIDGIMSDYSSRMKKPTWCEKSVFTIDGVRLIDKLFPEARYICLYRNCLDQVASAINTLDRDPTGSSYGFEPFLARTGTDTLNSLVDYWLAKMKAILAFENGHMEKCNRIQYESLVLETSNELERLFSFLGSHWSDEMINSILSGPGITGPGDYKISKTEGIRISSVGQGKKIDTDRITPDRLQKINQLHTILGYCAI